MPTITPITGPRTRPRRKRPNYTDLIIALVMVAGVIIALVA